MAAIADRTVETRDIDAALARGAIGVEQHAAILAIARERRRGHATADDEQFRLVTSFNDIFVSLAIMVLITGMGSLGGLFLSGRSSNPSPLGVALVAAAVAGTAWALAEFFTRRRRMALPSILLLLVFVSAIALAAAALTAEALQTSFGPVKTSVTIAGAKQTWTKSPGADLILGVTVAFAGLAGAAAAFFHWRRFHVPITIAAGAAALVGLVFGVARAAFPDLDRLALWLAAACGLAVFALAMRFDMADPARETRRADVAFWLHLLAAPLIVHPLMSALGLFSGDPSPALAAVVIALYLAFTFVALTIDRRALLVSALGYVIYAIFALLKQGSEDLRFPLTALVIGLFLVSLSALWHRARAALLGAFPPALTARLPVAAG